MRAVVTKGMMESMVKGETETSRDFLRFVNVKSPNEIDYNRIVTLETADIPDGPATDQDNCHPTRAPRYKQ